MANKNLKNAKDSRNLTIITNQNISLFVLAAGMGSRYGGLKQMEGFGPSGETLIDYSIYDAINAGFNKVVFVIRPDMEEIFTELFMTRYRDMINLQYVFQSVDKLPNWYKHNSERVKPWGTGHALLMAKDVIKEPTLIINGDDFYGSEAFEVSAKFLKKHCNENTYGITTYKLKNVLSENGTVKRGLCKGKKGYLEGIEELFEIKREGDGKISAERNGGEKVVLKDDDYISMNMFGVHPFVFPSLEKKFEKFLGEHPDSLTDEFLLPSIFDEMIAEKEVKFKMLHSEGTWVGVTYKEDAPFVKKKLNEFVQNGQYPQKLFK